MHRQLSRCGSQRCCAPRCGWLWRARRNAGMFCLVGHRRSRGWIIGAWICPVVWGWFPKQIVDDIWRASDSRLTVDNLRTLAWLDSVSALLCLLTAVCAIAIIVRVGRWQEGRAVPG